MTSIKRKNAAELEAELAAISRSQAIIEFSPSGTILTANDNYLQTLGYELDEVVGKHHSIFMEQGVCDTPAYEDFWTGLREGRFRSGEFSRVRKDGTPIWLHASYNPVFDLNGRPFKIIKVAADITAQVVTRQALVAVMNAVLDGLVTFGQNSVIESFNPAAVGMFGYQADEVIGLNMKLLIPELYHSTHDSLLRTFPDVGAATASNALRDLQGRHKDGRVFPIEIGVSEMHVAGKRMFVCSIRDITERKLAEAAMQASMAALSRSNQELDDFAYIASHDLKEPLRGLANNALFLKEDFGDLLGESGGRRLARITYLCERMERLVNDLLYFSRLGRQDLAIRQTDLNGVVNDIALMMESTLTEAHARIVVPERLPVVVCDATRITEVFRNLITNAVKYNDKPEKHVEIGFRPSAAGPVYYVRDNGIGIAPEFHRDVFRIFKRLNTEDDAVKGTGVGLTFVKKIVERQGGAVWICSEPGVGTTFHFTLNASEGE